MGAARTIRRETQGKRLLELVEKDGQIYGKVDGKLLDGAKGDNADLVWHVLQDEAGQADPRYFGYAGARQCFLKFFPGGFRSDGYANGERNYKVAAKKKLQDTVPLDAALDGTGFGEAALSVFRATNLLSPFEQTRLQGLLRGSDADEVIRAIATFADRPETSSLARLAAILKPHGCANWTVATYLPFLWLPDRHMFLKPMVTKEYATRVGHSFGLAYAARLDFSVYAELLDLAGRTSRELQDLELRDNIDVQSFIWVVGAYREGDGDTKV